MISNALALQEGFWPVLALDHGLTGYDDAVPTSEVRKLVTECAPNIGSVVMTYGLARSFGEATDVPLIIQCFGAPSGTRKVQICHVDTAARLGAKGVAVQIDFDLPEEYLAHQISAIADFVSLSHTHGMPVLFMITPGKIARFQDAASRIRACHELGADLIKIRCDASLLKDISSNVNATDLFSSSPPVLLAGGPANNNIYSENILAKEIGFSGYCIGRNVYQSDNPAEVAKNFRDEWLNGGGNE